MDRHERKAELKREKKAPIRMNKNYHIWEFLSMIRK
jgi:hypothetical protein